MDAGKAFSYQFDDPDWSTKLGLGALISLVPILNFALTGYMIETIRNMAGHVSSPLPTWDNLSKKFIDGLILAAAGLIYTAPIWILVCLPLAIFAASGALSQNGNLENLSRSIAAAGGLVLVCLLGLFVLYSLVLSAVYPAILVMFSREGTFASCFKLAEAFRMIAQNTNAFLLTWLFSFLSGIFVGFVVGFVSAAVSWIPCIGWIIGFVLAAGSSVYILTVHAHLFGQFRLAAEGEAATGSPAPM